LKVQNCQINRLSICTMSQADVWVLKDKWSNIQ